MTMTLNDLVQHAQQHPEHGDCVLHLSVPEVTYSPIVSVKHEPCRTAPVACCWNSTLTARFASHSTPQMSEYRYSQRGCIRRGEVFRARGGPTFKGSRCGDPGLYRMLNVEQQDDRVYLLAVPVDRHGTQTGGQKLLFVKGDEYDGLSCRMRPYRVSRVRT